MEEPPPPPPPTRRRQGISSPDMLRALHRLRIPVGDATITPSSFESSQDYTTTRLMHLSHGALEALRKSHEAFLSMVASELAQQQWAKDNGAVSVQRFVTSLNALRVLPPEQVERLLVLVQTQQQQRQKQPQEEDKNPNNEDEGDQQQKVAAQQKQQGRDLPRTRRKRKHKNIVTQEMQEEQERLLAQSRQTQQLRMQATASTQKEEQE